MSNSVVENYVRKIAETKHKTEQTKILTQSGIINSRNTLFKGAQLSQNINKEKIDLDLYRYFRFSIGSSLNGLENKNIISASIDSSSNNIRTGTDLISKTIAEKTKPVSSFMGSVIGTATGVLNDPLGSAFSLPNTIGAIMDRTNPSMRSQLELSMKKFHADKLIEMPRSIYGSLDQFSKKLNNALEGPTRLITDVYYGALDIIISIDNFIDELYKTVEKFAISMINNIFPGLMEFLDALVGFVEQVSVAISAFGAGTQLTTSVNQVLNYAQSATQLLENPLNALFSQLPESTGSGLYILQNPDSLIQQYIPPQLDQFMKSLSTFSGLGRPGNTNYGFGQLIETFRTAALSSILDQYAAQYNILMPLFEHTVKQLDRYMYSTGTVEVTDSQTTAYYQTTPNADKTQTFSRKETSEPITKTDNPPINYAFSDLSQSPTLDSKEYEEASRSLAGVSTSNEITTIDR